MSAMSNRFGRLLMTLSLGAMASPALVSAQADQYPSKPIKILVPYSPGGATDIIARILAAKLPEALGQSVVVENRAGASGNIALDAIAGSPADGYTLFVGNVSTNAINETATAKTLKSKPSRDLAGVTNLIDIPHVIVAPASSPANNIREFIDMAKAKPGSLNYSSTGAGTYPHLDMLNLMKVTGMEMTHIPYSGAGPIITAIVGSQVQVTFLNLASSLPHIKAGKMKALAAVPTERLAELPNVPTLTEMGLAGVGTNAWQGLFAPAATPQPVLDRIYAAVVKVMSPPETREQLAKQMMNVSLSKSPADYTAFMREQTKKWGEFITQNNVKVD
jgi:tripartite-type tricarboxylate transporter receptor subunit TctC